MEQYGCSFSESLKIINSDFGLGLGTSYINTKRIKKLKEKIIPIEPLVKEDVNFTCTVTPFSTLSLNYWSRFNITEDILQLFNVFEIVEIRRQGQFYRRASDGNPIFGYFFDTTNKVKFYRPLHPRKKGKWDGNVTKQDINGWDQLPEKGELLYITSSMKDVMTLYSLGFTAMAPQGEGYRFEPELIEELNSRFKTIIILYDSDDDGIVCAKKLNAYSKWSYQLIEEDNPDIKDISDYMDYILKNGGKSSEVKQYLINKPVLNE